MALLLYSLLEVPEITLFLYAGKDRERKGKGKERERAKDEG
jgi:hypothetical protein